MDLAIGTPTTDDANGSPYYFAEYGFDHFLDAHHIGLPLPAMIIQPLIGNMEKITFDGGLNYVYKLCIFDFGWVVLVCYQIVERMWCFVKMIDVLGSIF